MAHFGNRFCDEFVTYFYDLASSGDDDDADGSVAVTDGAASVADTGMDVDTDATPSVTADDAHAFGALVAGADMAVGMLLVSPLMGLLSPLMASLTTRLRWTMVLPPQMLVWLLTWVLVPPWLLKTHIPPWRSTYRP